MSDSIDVLELMVERLTAEVKALRFEESALRRDAAELTAENARLRAEVERLQAERKAQNLVVNSVTDQYEAQIAALTADLARVTAERDGLLRACKLVRITEPGGVTRWTLSHYAIVAFDEAIAACAPPASGEVKP